MPDPTVEIAGVDRTGKTACDSVSIRRSISDRSTMNCGLVERSGVYRPVVGNVIIVEQEQVVGSPGSAVRKFAGYIEDIEEEHVPGNLGNILYQLQCTDFTRMLDWKLYAGSFDAGVTFLSVITAIWSAKLQADGVTLAADIPSTPLPNRVQDGLRPLSEWFRKLATDTGYLYRIDEYKVLHFGPLATSPPNPAPFSLTFGSLNWRNLKIRKRLGDYRNVQYARTEYNISGVLTANFTGDGSTRDFFQIDGPFHGKPTVTLDGTPLNVGIFGVDSGNPAFDTFYVPEGWAIYFPITDPAPGNGLAIVVQYRVRFNNTSVAFDSVEIAARAAIQGDSGSIEAVNEDRYIDTKSALDARAANLLRQYGAVPTGVEFENDSRIEPFADDLEPGMQLPIDLTDGPSNVDDLFLVESIESKWKAAAPDDVWKHRIQCTDQEPYGNRPQSGGGAGAVPIVLERLSEAVRIGPDIATVLTESEESSTVTWSATLIDDASPLVTGTDLSNHRPIDVQEGFRIDLTEWFAALEIAAVSTVTFAIQVSGDNGSSWSTVLTQSFSAGQKAITGEAFAIETLYRGERLRYNLTTADGTAGILTIVLNGRKVIDGSPA